MVDMIAQADGDLRLGTWMVEPMMKATIINGATHAVQRQSMIGSIVSPAETEQLELGVDGQANKLSRLVSTQ